MKRLLLASSLLVFACSEPQSDVPATGAAGPSSGSSAQGGAGQGGAGQGGPGQGGGDGGLGPGPLDTLTLTLTTKIAEQVLADEAPLELCLNATRCFELIRPERQEAGKKEAGELAFDVHTFEKVNLPHDEVDRFELRPGKSSAFTPVCMSVRFNGKPVHCTRSFTEPLGAGFTRAVDAPSDCFGCFARGEDTDLRITHGPFLGDRDAGKKTASVWLRADASLPVALYLSKSADMSDRWLADTRTPRPEDDFTLTLLAKDLLPGARYHYQVETGGVLHAPKTGDQHHPGGTYSFEMPPAPGEASQFSFALGSCARMFKHGNYDALRDQAPALFLSVGDYQYGNVLEQHFVRRADEPYDHDVAALNDMRWWYRTAHWEKESMLAKVPTVNTWDDHDYGGGEEYADRDAEGRTHSRRALLEYFANPKRAENEADEGIYFRFSHGDVDFFVLDARYHRPRLCGFTSGGTACKPEEDPLGKAQSDWLVAGLSESKARFKLVAAGTRFYGGGAKAWTPFLAARDALLDRIVKAGVGGVFFLSGGPHSTQYRTFSAAGRTWHEVVSSPLSSGLGSCLNQPGLCYDAVKNFVMVDVDTVASDPTLSFRIVTFAGEKPWPGPSAKVVVKRSALQ